MLIRRRHSWETARIERGRLGTLIITSKWLIATHRFARIYAH